jgi:hypothetical protein
MPSYNNNRLAKCTLCKYAAAHHTNPSSAILRERRSCNNLYLQICLARLLVRQLTAEKLNFRMILASLGRSATMRLPHRAPPSCVYHGISLALGLLDKGSYISPPSWSAGIRQWPLNFCQANSASQDMTSLRTPTANCSVKEMPWWSYDWWRYVRNLN